jgi:hypothetical protein
LEGFTRYLGDAHHTFTLTTNGYKLSDPGWAKGLSAQPRHKPSHTPEPMEQRVVTLHQTLVQRGHRGSAAAIQHRLQQQGIEPMPALRTIYRILQRHA